MTDLTPEQAGAELLAVRDAWTSAEGLSLSAEVVRREVAAGLGLDDIGRQVLAADTALLLGRAWGIRSADEAHRRGRR